MAKNKDYSAEAIIALAQNAAYQDQKAMGKQITDRKKNEVTGNQGTTNPVPTNPSLVLPKQQPVKLTENAPAPKPYMAMAVTKDGMPVYGSGLQGWARKAWADLTDPVKYFYDKKKLSQEQQDKVTSEFEAGKKQAGLVIEDKLKWSQWGEKMFGITAEELGIIAPLGKAERDIAKEAGESAVGTAVARTARIGLDTTQNVIWGGLAILGLGDQAVRKINSTMQGIDAVADKFNRDDTDNFVEKITVNNPISVGRDIYTIAKAIAAGKTTWADTKETVSKYQAGSEMVYSMVFENNARAEFEKGLAEGKDPVVLAQELGSIGIELAGSILGDPTTYLGLSLVKPVNIFSKTAREAGNLVKVGSFSTRLPWKTIAKIPEFGEIIGATVGRARLANEAQRFLSVPPEIEKVFKGVTNSFGEIDANKVSRETVKTIVARYSTKAVEPLSQMPIQKTTKFWNLSTYTAESKISIASKDASIWLQNMLAKVNGIDNAFLVLSDMKAIRKGGTEAEEAAARLLTHGSMVFSPVGEMVGEVLTRLDDDKIFDIIKKYGDNKVNLHNELFKKLGGIIDDFIPSVEEMSKAVDKVKEAKLAGLVPDERTLKLAEMYDDVPAIVKTVNKITKVPLAVAGKTSGAMVTLFMQFVPRSWSRNIQGAFLPMAARIGLFNALDVSISAMRGLSKEGPLGIKALGTTDLLKRVDDDIFKMLDFVPFEDGIGKMVGTNKGIFKIGMLDSIKRSEMIMGRRIIAQSVRDSISNALPAVVKDMPQWDNFVSTLPKEQQALPFAALERAYGNVDEAEKILRGWIGKGEIDVWKLIEPPQALKKYLEDNGLAQAFATARDNAKSSDEFAASVQGWVDDYKKTIDNAFKNQPVTSTAFAEHGDFGMDLAKQVPEKQRETIAALYQSWHNTQKALTDAYKTVLATADQMVAKIPDDIVNGAQDSTKRMNASNQLAQLKTSMDDTMDMTEAAWQRVDNIRTEFVKDIKSAKTPEEFKAMFNKVYQAGTFKFSLRDIYPTATEVTPDFVKSGGWSAFFEFASETHKGANSSRYGQVMTGLEEVAKMFGSTIDDMAGGNKAGDNVFNVLQTHYADAIKFEQQHAMERFFRAWEFSKEKQMANTINLKDAAAKFKTQFPNWEGNVDNFIAQVNAKDSEKTKIAKLAGARGIPSSEWSSKTNRYVPADKKLLNIVNSYAMKLAGDVDTTVGKTAKTKDAFKYLSKNGGISPSDFAEAFGDTIGKQRMIPGLVQKNAGDIDRVGIRLWEGGFISREQADDANFVRDFLRNFKPTQVDDEARLAAKEAADFQGFRSLDEVPSGIADEAFRLHAEEKGLKPQSIKQEVSTTAAAVPEPTDVPYYDEAGNLVEPKVAEFVDFDKEKNRAIRYPDYAYSFVKKYAPDKAGEVKNLRGENLNNFLNQITPSEKVTEAPKELTMADAIEAFKATRLAPPETGLLPTETEVLARGLKNFEGDVKRWTDAVVKEWGVKTKTIPPEQMPDFKNLWNEAKAAIKPRMDHVKLEAGVTGVSTRNFVLHDYNKTYADHALSMMLGNSFHYWTTRTYSRALETLVENPKYANMYMRYKEYNTKRHSDQPEWYRQNIQIDNVMGIPLKNPYFVNLEAAINPMYGLTGTDFNDPKKRVDWMSRAVDDMNKMGPSFSPLISWAIGMNMFRKGEQEAGQRWMGRLLPPSVLVKSASSALLGKPIEIDPFVNFLDGGVDPYERNRVAAALANMVRTGEITSEEMIEASRMKEGPIWEAGIEASATARFGSDATSFFLGAGLRPRTEDDMKIEKFWQDYGAMIASSSMMSSDQYRQQWDKMRDNPEYGMFMDALLLSRKSGDDMDSAYVYNVLSRIPPGQLNDISEIAGIRPDLLQSFYDNKGDFDRMGIPPQDRQILIGQVVNIGAILAMPDTATRQEWSIAKTQYKQMQDMLTETFGEGINELMSEYYSVENQADWLEANPDVDAAMKLKDQIVMSNPSLNQYYGGIQVIERYYTTAMENDLIKKYGEDIKDQETEYYDLLSDAEQKAYKASHPNLKPYWKDKTAFKAEMQKKLDAIAKDLPDKPLPQLRPNVTPENVPQEQLQNMSPIPFSDWEKNLGTPITSLIQEYANGADLPRQVRSALDYEAYKYGFYDGDAMLQAIMQSLPQ